jgi:hypothetical protein
MKRFLQTYKWYIIVSLILFVVATVVLIVLSTGPQRGPFIYQIH